jgi:hypothetical protein
MMPPQQHEESTCRLLHRIPQSVVVHGAARLKPCAAIPALPPTAKAGIHAWIKMQPPDPNGLASTRALVVHQLSLASHSLAALLSLSVK